MSNIAKIHLVGFQAVTNGRLLAMGRIENHPRGQVSGPTSCIDHFVVDSGKKYKPISRGEKIPPGVVGIECARLEIKDGKSALCGKVKGHPAYRDGVVVTSSHIKYFVTDSGQAYMPA